MYLSSMLWGNASRFLPLALLNFGPILKLCLELIKESSGYVILVIFGFLKKDTCASRQTFAKCFFFFCVFIILPEENNMHCKLLGLMRCYLKSPLYFRSYNTQQIYILGQAIFKT